jgi:hypothetical protein
VQAGSDGPKSVADLPTSSDSEGIEPVPRLDWRELLQIGVIEDMGEDVNEVSQAGGTVEISNVGELQGRDSWSSSSGDVAIREHL